MNRPETPPPLSGFQPDERVLYSDTPAVVKGTDREGMVRIQMGILSILVPDTMLKKRKK